MQETAIVIPAFEPTPALKTLICALQPAFGTFLVIDDGSRHAREIFDAVEKLPGVILLRHAENRGKGAALKTAFAYLSAKMPRISTIVTADADGQHLPEDIRRIAQAAKEHPGRLTLGTRTFGRNVPFRSRWGNLWTCGEFFLLTGVWLGDTQTGLRAFSREWLDALLSLAGARYEFESRMLVFAARATGAMVRLPITTVYLDHNASSHYRPLADTVKTQSALFQARFCPLPAAWKELKAGK
jgi:glycosyltransferase involved in cell wall biosynthesis